eukprot:1153035-Pelagomonas_calceolata.AAC.5
MPVAVHCLSFCTIPCVQQPVLNPHLQVVLPPTDRLHVTFSPEDAVAKALSSTPPPPTPAFRSLRTAPLSSSRVIGRAGGGAGVDGAAGGAAAATEQAEAASAGAKLLSAGNETEGGEGGSAAQRAAAPAPALSPFAADRSNRAWQALQFGAQSVFGSAWAHGTQDEAGATAQQMEQLAMDSQGVPPAGNTRTVLPASRLRNSLMRLGLTSTRGAPEDDDALSRVASSSLIDGEWLARGAYTLHTDPKY